MMIFSNVAINGIIYTFSDLRGLLMVALRSQRNWRWEGPLGTPLGLVHWKRASSPVEAGTAGYL